MRSVKSRARKQSTGLTVTQATSQARRYVDKIMPGVAATVESRLSADAATLAPIVITSVTFPADAFAAGMLAAELQGLPGFITGQCGSNRLTITRAR